MFTNWGQRLKHARKSADFEQKGLAHAMGVSVATMSRWEREVSAPSKPEWALLGNLLSVREQWLVDGEEPMRIPPVIGASSSALVMGSNQMQAASKVKFTGTVELTTGPGNVGADPLFANPWKLLEEVTESLGMQLSREDRIKVVFLASAKAIAEKRDPIRKDIFDALDCLTDRS